jgi:putative membrane protein
MSSADSSSAAARPPSDDAAVELFARRTGMSFQRTRMSADRTLMSVIRTALSLIGFGVTISQFVQNLHEAQVIKSSAAAGNFGIALVLLGNTMLLLGIGYHVLFMAGLRKERAQMKQDDLVQPESGSPISLTLVVALLLLMTGLLAIVSMVFKVGPFG